MTRTQRSWLNRLRQEGPLSVLNVAPDVAHSCIGRGWTAETGDGTDRDYLTPDGLKALDAEGAHADGV